METLIVGVGNVDYGDDAAGIVAARGLRVHGLAGVRIVECSGEATELIDVFAGARRVFIIDAAQLGKPAGAVRRFDAAVGPLPQTLSDYSSHSFGVAQGVELARALGTLPERCAVYAIQGECYEAGRPLSAPVRAAVEQVERLIADELNRGEAVCTKRI